MSNNQTQEDSTFRMDIITNERTDHQLTDSPSGLEKEDNVQTTNKKGK